MTPPDRETEIARGIVAHWVTLFMPGREMADTPSAVLQSVLVSEIADALRALTAERDALAAVWREIVDQVDEWTLEFDAEPILDTARAAGLYERILYDPVVHGEEVDAEPGEDMIYVLTPLGRRLAEQPPAAPEGT